jgi:dihydrofolate reductase
LKVVLSKTMKGTDLPNTKIISENLSNEIRSLKQQNGKNILIFGSPTAVHSLMKENFIDEYWLFINPVLLGEGIPLFKGIEERKKLKLLENKVFSSGVACLHYRMNAGS